MGVLVLAGADDPTATRVASAVDDRGCPVVRLDLGDFPGHVTITAAGPDFTSTGRLSVDGREVGLADVTAVYYRRPSSFGLAAGLSDEHRRFATAEARQTWAGLLSCLPCPVVNRPARCAEAELKPAQLRVAAEVGLSVPRTLITSVGADAREFVRSFDRVLYKPLSAPILHRDGQVQMIYASLVDPDEIVDAEVALSPCQLQEFVPKAYDVRLTVVGDDCFAARVHAGSEEAYVDWRSDYSSLTYEVVDTPDVVARGTRAYLDRFGLSMGCFDFSVSVEDRRWWFLECGPNAQWGWIEHETGLPIAASVAALLTGGPA